MYTVYSVNGVPIRFTYERWHHIIDNHDDLAGYYDTILTCVESPLMIIQGNNKSLKAIRNISKHRWLVVVYKELNPLDGFIITAYFLNKKPKGKVIWKLH